MHRSELKTQLLKISSQKFKIQNLQMAQIGCQKTAFAIYTCNKVQSVQVTISVNAAIYSNNSRGQSGANYSKVTNTKITSAQICSVAMAVSSTAN